MTDAADQEGAGKQGPPDDGRLRVGLDAPGLTPQTVDPVLALATARAYLEFVQAAGRLADKTFGFRGLEIERGSCQVAVTPNDRAKARSAVAQVRGMLEGRRRTPKGLGPALDEVKRTIRGLPKDHSAFTSYGRSHFQIFPKDLKLWTEPDSITTIRATLVRVGGLPDPRARFFSRFENNGDLFSVAVTSDEAKRLARDLYAEWEITVQISRDPDGKIESAKLLESELVRGDLDAFEAFRDWFKKNASEWVFMPSTAAATSGSICLLAPAFETWESLLGLRWKRASSASSDRCNAALANPQPLASNSRRASS